MHTQQSVQQTTHTQHAALDGIRLVQGHGYNDVDETTSFRNEEGKLVRSKWYSTWLSMLQRAYGSPAFKAANPTYDGCTVCDEWLLASNFKQWFDMNYQEGFELDKDLIVLGNMEYSPTVCSFVPCELNNAFNVGKRKKKRVNGMTLPKGVYQAQSGYKAVHQTTILGYFHNVDEAFEAYSEAKREYLKNVLRMYGKRLSSVLQPLVTVIASKDKFETYLEHYTQLQSKH